MPGGNPAGIVSSTPQCSRCGVLVLHFYPYTAEQAESQWRPLPHDDLTQRQLVYSVILTEQPLFWGRR